MCHKLAINCGGYLWKAFHERGFWRGENLFAIMGNCGFQSFLPFLLTFIFKWVDDSSMMKFNFIMKILQWAFILYREVWSVVEVVLWLIVKAFREDLCYSTLFLINFVILFDKFRLFVQFYINLKNLRFSSLFKDF